MPKSAPAESIAAVRCFNRFYTQHLGVLQQAWLDSPFSLTEARVLYEIRERSAATASEIARELDLDAGYLSRILRRFQKNGLVRKEPSPEDGRQSMLAITPEGRKAFAPLEARTNQQIGELLARLSVADREQLVSALRIVEQLVANRAGESGGEVTLRAHRPGDMGWVVARHAEIYAAEFGWSGNFEAVCARIVADFVDKLDVSRERCWIAELDGCKVGSVFLVADTRDVARLRLLLVDPIARGRGLGGRLTDECIAFARASGYRRLTLWTHKELTAARRIYAEAGFTLTSSEAMRNFGKRVVSEHWDLTL